MDAPRKCPACNKLTIAWQQVYVRNLPPSWTLAQVHAWVATYGDAPVFVKLFPAVCQAIVTFRAHVPACVFLTAVKNTPHRVTVKRVVYLLEAAWYVVPPMFLGSLPVVPITPAMPVTPVVSSVDQRVAYMEARLEALMARVLTLEAELAALRSDAREDDYHVSKPDELSELLEDCAAVAPLNAPLSPKSLYTPDEVESFLKECLP